jgi:hypothetical protein
MKVDFTHTAYEVGVDARTTKNYRRKVLLRETKTMWISKDGRRYLKRSGGYTAGDWPMFKLDIETITEI